MKTTSRLRWIGRGILLVATALALISCGNQALPPPVASTSTPLPPPPTEAATSTPPPAPTSTPPPAPTNTPQPTPTEAATSAPPVPTDTPQAAPTEAAEKPSAELAEAANLIYTQNSCSACHGANYEGGLGSILAGLPAEYIQAVTRSGEPEAGMPAYDQNAISNDDLSTLADFLSSLTLQDIGVELAPAVVDHLSQAWDALQADDGAAVETHLSMAQEAGADAPPGVQATLKGLVEGLGEADWVEATEARLEVLLGQ